MIDLVHLINIDKNNNDKTIDGALLCHPEAKLKSKKANIIEKIHKQNCHNK
jgi:hypothetical protein